MPSDFDRPVDGPIDPDDPSGCVAALAFGIFFVVMAVLTVLVLTAVMT